MGYFPVYLDLRGRRCVVIGDDDEAQMKAGALVEAGRRRHRHLPRGTASIHGNGGARVKITLHSRGYEPGDLKDAFLGHISHNA